MRTSGFAHDAAYEHRRADTAAIGARFGDDKERGVSRMVERVHRNRALDAEDLAHAERMGYPVKRSDSGYAPNSRTRRKSRAKGF